MGTGKVIKCKNCDYELDLLEGIGFDNTPKETEEKQKCPQCGSEDFEDTEIKILWDQTTCKIKQRKIRAKIIASFL